MKKTKFLVVLLAVLFVFGMAVVAVRAESADAVTTQESESSDLGIAFTLIEKLQDLSSKELIMLLSAIVLVLILIVAVCLVCRTKPDTSSVTDKKIKPMRAVIFGALCMSLSFILSYIKVLSMPFGGSITLCSMLPIMLYASWVGPGYGFLMAFAYGLLQCLQDWYVIHPVQFFMDYVLAFTALGLMSFFKTERQIPLGIIVSGFARTICSVISGAVFFSEYAPEGMNVWLYTTVYNFMSIGVDTLICLVVYMLPPVRKTFARLKNIMVS